jgi:cation transport ATPase
VYSRHPLAAATLSAAKEQGLALARTARTSANVRAKVCADTIDGQEVQVTSRKKLLAQSPDAAALLPAQAGGLECVLLHRWTYAATFRTATNRAPRGSRLSGT